MKSLILKLIKAYQALTRSGVTTPILLGAYSGCRSWPTCSEYAIEAIERDGLIRGARAAIWRFARCHPLSSGHPS